MPTRLKVLISAYACEPGKGSEPEVGWQWALQMARFHDVTVLTRENNQPLIEPALRALEGKQPLPHFVYYDRSQALLRFKRRFHATTVYYLLWQRGARDVIARLHAMHHFDLMHHVTFAAFRYPIAVWGHGAPCIWGPIGGIESIPSQLLPWRHPASIIHEVARNCHNLLQATPFHVLPRRARASSLILASTAEMRQAFSRLGFETRVMPTIGLKTAELPFQPRRRPEGPLKALFVGNLITLKGLDLALEALAQSGTDATFTLVGAGNFEGAARQQVARLGLESRVRFLGRLPRARVLETYAGYDLFLFPSLHDTGGYAVIEAMFNELPVVCLDCGGPAVAVEAGCGVKVPVASRAGVIAGLAAALRRYDQDRELLAAEGRAARQKVLRDYDWDRKGLQMNECYTATMSRAHDPAAAVRYSGMGGLTNMLHRMFSVRGTVAALLMLLLTGALGFVSLNHLRSQARDIVEDTLPGLSSAGEANANLAQAFNRSLFLLLTDDPGEQSSLRREIELYSARTTDFLNTYRQQIFAPEDKLLFDRLQSERKDYLLLRQRLFDLLESGRRVEATALCRNELLQSFQRYKACGDRLFEYNMRQGQVRGHRIMTVGAITQIVVAAIAALFFVAGFFIGMFK